MKKENIAVFSNELFGEIRAVVVDEETYFVGKDVAAALGYKDINKAVKDHVDKEDMKACNRKAYADLYPSLWDNDNDFSNKVLINESGVYSLIFSSKLESAKAFKRWVTSEILPTLRKSGLVVLEHAEKEAVDYQSKYGRYRIRKTFTESKNLRETYEEYAALSKIERDAKRIDNKDRIRSCKTIINVLEEKIANEVLSLKPSELLAIQELICDIQADITVLHNRLNGGKKSAQTKRIQQLEEENKSLKEQIDEDDNYYFIDKSGFSVNYMYSYGKDKVVKSAAYHRWINSLHLEQYLPEEYPGVDFTQPLRITILFGHKRTMDTHNLGKAIIDQIAEYYGFNDSLIADTELKKHDYVESHEDGYMYIKIENI